ncbi:MAG: hypothetical protein KAS32_06870 [Candidatus Peribacteraceae bacterium]|nr:hypothetical protein [Candidatus Peribacteraceae bacterium]
MLLKKPIQIRTALRKLGNKIEIEDIDSDTGYFMYVNVNKPKICMLRLLEEDKQIKAFKITSEFLCREELATEIFSNRLNKKAHFSNEDASVFMFRYNSKKSVLSTMRVLNHFERRARWGLSFVVPTQDDNCVVFVGSRYWSETTINISMYLLLLRLVSFNELEKREGALQYMTRLVSENNTTDKNFLKDLYEIHPNLLQIIMKHRLMLYNGVCLKDKYENDCCGEEGINILSQDAITLIRLKKAHKNIPQKEIIENFTEDYYEGVYRYGVDRHLIEGKFITRLNRGVLSVLTKLLTKYEGKRVSL